MTASSGSWHRSPFDGDRQQDFYAASRATLYRALRGDDHPRDAHRADRGHARVMGDGEIERWYEIVAAVKKSTTNRKGRYLWTARALKLVEEHGVHTPDAHRQLPPRLLIISTRTRYVHIAQSDCDDRSADRFRRRATAHLQRRRFARIGESVMSLPNSRS